jgi:predicted nucleic acid-binding protein
VSATGDANVLVYASNAADPTHQAALMRQHGVRMMYTRDRDFRRFDGIEAHDPFA